MPCMKDTVATMINKLKFALLAVLIALPVVAHAPATVDRNLAGLTDSEYIKVYPIRAIFDDRFTVYVFGRAERWNVKNPKGFQIQYNKKMLYKLDSDNNILDIRATK